MTNYRPVAAQPTRINRISRTNWQCQPTEPGETSQISTDPSSLAAATCEPSSLVARATTAEGVHSTELLLKICSRSIRWKRSERRRMDSQNQNSGIQQSAASWSRTCEAAVQHIIIKQTNRCSGGGIGLQREEKQATFKVTRARQWERSWNQQGQTAAKFRNTDGFDFEGRV